MVDSLGNALTPGQEAFFRYSKARDASGNLLVCYHGTDRGGFTTFHKGTTQRGIMGSPGIFFTSNPDVARTYTDTSREPDSPGGNSIYQCYLNITNPLEVECGGRGAFDCQVEIGDRVYYHIDDICEYASSHGYDGVIARNVVDDMGYGYRDKGHVGDDLVAFNPNQVKLISNTNPTTSTSITEELLLEKTRQELIDKSKSGADYSSSNQQRGRNRWERRKYSQVANSVRDYNSIDMDAFWKGDILEFGIRVRGETDDYVVTVLFEGILAELRREVAGNHNKLEFKCVLRALLKVFNTGDVYISCSCLHPDTRIKLLDGTVPTVREMCERFDRGERLYTYSTDENGDFKPGEVERVWVTKTAREFIKVTLDNGKEILTTPEHPYMLRDGSYMLAGDLKVGQSLMPMYFNSVNGYETVKLNSESRGWHTIYKLVANCLKQSEIEEAKLRVTPEDNMSYDVAIHHKDFNKKNNNPENLQVMTAREHWNYHNSLTWEEKPEEMKQHIREVARQTAIKTNSNPSEKMKKSREMFLYKGILRNYDEDRKQQQAEIMRRVRDSYYKDMSEEEKKRYSALLTAGIKNNWKKGCFNTKKFHDARVREGKRLLGNHDNQINMAKCKMLKALQRMVDDKVELSVDNYNIYRKKNRASEYSKYFSSFEEMVSEFKLNHKIAKVERVILDDTPVYDIKVKEWGNFVTDAGVVLHNCPDWKYRMAYFATKNRYNSGTPEVRPSDITNPGDTKGAGCKHSLLVISNLDWMMKVASVINNYVKWCRQNMERNYAQYIFPQVYGVPYNRAVQMSLFDDPNDNGLLPSDQGTIGKAIERGMQGKDARGRWTSGNPYRFSKSETQGAGEDNPNQLHLDLGFGDGKAKSPAPEGTPAGGTEEDGE